jgi:hypothetical protein
MRDDNIEALSPSQVRSIMRWNSGRLSSVAERRVRRTRQRRPSVLCHPCLHLRLLIRDRQIVLGLPVC